MFIQILHSNFFMPQTNPLKILFVINPHSGSKLKIDWEATVLKYFEEGHLRGKLGYFLRVFKVLWRKKMMSVTIRTDKEEITRKAFMVVIANASKYGTGAMINPEGNLHDGLFEIVIVRRIAFLS